TNPHDVPPAVKPSAEGDAGAVGGCQGARLFAGSFDGTNWLAGWDPGSHVGNGAGNLEVTTDLRFGSVLRVHYPAGSIDPGGAAVTGGAQFRAKLPGLPRESVCLSYWLRFDPAFQFVRGGKLPGLCGGDCPSGGDQTNGVTGWS